MLVALILYEMNKKYILAVDQGTTGTRCIIFDHENNIISKAYEEHKQIYPRPGWVEHNPIEIWEKTQIVIKRAIERAKIEAHDIATIGVSNQRETIVAWNPRTGRPYYNAIVWQDARTRERCNELKKEGHEETIHSITGLYTYTYFSSTKIEWLLKEVPKISEALKKGEVIFGTIDTWIIWNLTRGNKDVLTPERNGAHVTDYTNASRTMLMDIKRLKWSSDLLRFFNIPEDTLPIIRPSSDEEVYGYTSLKGLFKYEIPITGDLGDQQAALVGQVSFNEGDAKNTYGTGNFMLLNIGKEPRLSRHGLLTTVAYGFKEVRYALEGSIAITGAAIQWLRDNLGIISNASETEEIAKSVSDVGSAGVYFVPAFSGLYAPYWDLDARGIIIGLTRFIRKEHLIHATLEQICWQTRDVFEAMTKDTNITLGTLKVDGGAAVNNYLMQLQADTLGCNVIRPAITETTSLGVAYAAGLAVNFWSNLRELRELWKVDRVFKPKWSRDKREKLYHGWKEAVKRARGWLKDVGELPSSGTIIN